MPSLPRPSLEEARARRAKKRENRQMQLEDVVSGWDYDKIAKYSGISVAKVRREIDRALAMRRANGAQSYVKLQQARLDKALDGLRPTSS